MLQRGKAPLQSEADRPQGDAVGQHYVPALHLLSIPVKGAVWKNFTTAAKLKFTLVQFESCSENRVFAVIEISDSKVYF
jgi:hypothetical protein